MAHETDDLEFLLPAELLTDDDFGGGLGSDLTSPVESVAAGHNDDFVAALTRKLAHYRVTHDYPVKSVKQSGSPQSTLCGLKTGSTGSPNAFSPPEVKDSLTWDLLYAAAEEAARIRAAEETAAFYSSNVFGPTRKPGSVADFYPDKAQAVARLSYQQQLHAAKLQQMKQHELILQNGGTGRGNMGKHWTGMRPGGGDDRAYGISMSATAWPTLQQSQQKTRDRVKPVFPGEPGPVKERVGTGVFMPRRFNSIPTETRKKPVQGLNIDSIDAHLLQKGFGNFSTNHDAVLKMSNVSGMVQGRDHLRPAKQELMLPQEWTY